MAAQKPFVGGKDEIFRTVSAGSWELSEQHIKKKKRFVQLFYLFEYIKRKPTQMISNPLHTQDTVPKHLMKCSLQTKLTPGGRQADALRAAVVVEPFECFLFKRCTEKSHEGNYFCWFSCTKF